MNDQATDDKKGGLLASTLVVSGMTLLSRVLGLVRDVVLARLLGASAGTDAFFVAFRIPNFLRRLFAEGPSTRPSCRCSANTAPGPGKRATWSPPSCSSTGWRAPWAAPWRWSP